MEMTEEQAKAYFEKLNSKADELSDDELDNVAGGVICILKSSFELQKGNMKACILQSGRKIRCVTY